MNSTPRELLAKRLTDHEEMSRAFGQAVQLALRRHKDMGNSIAVWRDGRVVIVPAEDIVLEDDTPMELELASSR